MIRISTKAEPSNFEHKVRRPGKAFLKRCPSPKSADFRRPNDYWREVASDLYEAYDRTCAYTSRYIETPYGSTDHFLSKVAHPHLAFEWSNLRLCLRAVNGFKGNLANIVDPFEVGDGWFVLDFPECLVRPGADLAADVHDRVKSTIDGLRLNSDDHVVQDRSDYAVLFARGDVSLEYLKRRRPFLASEFRRQGIDPARASALFKPLGP